MAPIRLASGRKLISLRQAVATLGLDGVRFHDLRHTANTLAAAPAGL